MEALLLLLSSSLSPPLSLTSDPPPPPPPPPPAPIPASVTVARAPRASSVRQPAHNPPRRAGSAPPPAAHAPAPAAAADRELSGARGRLGKAAAIGPAPARASPPPRIPAPVCGSSRDNQTLPSPGRAIAPDSSFSTHLHCCNTSQPLSAQLDITMKKGFERSLGALLQCIL
ncbi:max-binding protein MNT-like [Heterodontus francisci]|uniref:max-binding protein MNT-like n=1 Tax=Heterodontus francisci TaxID=7792 RepID=UPI00355B05B5